MHRLTSRYLRRSLVGVVVLAGCVTVQSPGSRRLESAGSRYEWIRDSVELATALDGDEVASTPRIRLVVPPAMSASTRYVDASFRLSEDAYVLVVAVDLDRRVRVLYPETPDQSGFAARSNPNRLTRFFAGFGGPGAGSFSRYDARYDPMQRISPFDGGGVLLAIASDRPLQLDRLIDPAGDWDEHELSRLIFDQSLASAAYAVGRAVVLTGQEYDTDYRTFQGGRTLGAYSSFASSSFGDCGYGYGDSGFGYGASYGGTVTSFLGFYQREGRTYARYVQGSRGCGRPLYHDVPVPTRPVVPRDTTKQDTTSSVAARRHPDVPVAPRYAGLRFRAPERVPADGQRPLGRRLSWRDVADSPARSEPVRSEPSRRELVPRESVHREPKSVARSSSEPR